MATVLPMPPHWDIPQQKKIDLCSSVWRVPYNERATSAGEWARKHGVKPSAADQKRVTLMLIDNQNTFCLPDFELFVGGRSGQGAIEDSSRIADFIYRNMATITQTVVTLDTHYLMQIFHPIFWVNAAKEHPIGGQTIITHDDVASGKWEVNLAVANALQYPVTELKRYVLHYTETLEKNAKLPLMVWPYHAMLGGIGHALVSAVEDAVFFHGVARSSQPNIQTKGSNSLTENYSIMQPEVKTFHDGRPLAQRNERFIEALMKSDVLYIAGQAKSHCMAWSIQDYLDSIVAVDPAMAERVVLLEDCTSPVVIPGVIDFTDQANEAYQKFADAGMKIRKSTDPIEV